MEQKEQRKHIWYFDYLRVFAMLCVIFMHVGAGAMRELNGLNWHLHNACMSAAFTAVPLFFMMSGYLLLHDPRTADVGYLLRHRLPKLAIPLAAWSVVAAAWYTWLGDRSLLSFGKWLVQALREPVMVHIWFLYMLLALYAVSPILYGGLKVLDRNGKRYVLVLLVLVMVQGTVNLFAPDATIDLFATLRLFEGHLTAFLLGYFLGELKRNIPNAMLLAVGGVDFLMILIGTWRLTVSRGEYTAAFQSQANGFEIVLAACIFLFFRQNCNRKYRLQPALGPWIAMSMGIYLCHNIVNSVLFFFFPITNQFYGTCLKTLIVLVCSYLLIKTLASIRPLCYLFTGIPYAGARRSCSWRYTVQNLSKNKK